MVQHREGELVGPIDWNYNFWPHFSSYCCDDDRKREFMERQIENLFALERRFFKGELLRVREGDYWHDLIDMGMYDGWPYWKPVPSIFVRSVLGGGTWRQFPCVDEFGVQRGKQGG